jgi:hypothetical protein
MHVALEQSSLRDAAAVILIVAVYEHTTAKYRTLGMRYIHMEVGHAAQNVYLQAVALGKKNSADQPRCLIGPHQEEVKATFNEARRSMGPPIKR